MTTPTLFEGRPLADPTEDIYDQGLEFDVQTLLDRRGMLKLMAVSGLGAGMLVLAGCAPSAGASATTVATATATPSAAAATGASTAGVASAAADSVIPEETAGPFPGDGSNGPDVLTESGVVRTDIRTSFASGSATAEGVPLTIQLTILDATNGFVPLVGAAVYVWHCNRAGQYSLYSDGVTGEDYLRGVQATGSDGVVTFTSVYPGCYAGRWPHIHFEVYPSLAKATDQGNKIATSQVALPEAASKTVYATDGYSQSITNLSQVTLASDNVFGDDGGVHELGTVTGSVSAGMTVALRVPVKTA